MTAPTLTLNAREAATATALFERLFPADEEHPGATEIGVLSYIDRALAGAYREHEESYRLGLAALDRCARARHSAPFADLDPTQQDALLRDLERGELPNFHAPPQQAFFALLRAHLQEGLFADPLYGGNRDKLGWRVLGHPGVWLENSAEENLTGERVTKGGVIQSLTDVTPAQPPLIGGRGHSLVDYAAPSAPDTWDKSERVTNEPTAPSPTWRGLGRGLPPEHEHFDPDAGAKPADGPCDVVIVGVGAMGGLVAPVLAEAGLSVVGLEAGPYRTQRDFLPDELGHAYYARASMGPKFASEAPRWQRNQGELVEGEETRPATFSLGRMMNSVGGSVIHYGAWLRRFHPHHFRPLSRVAERWGRDVLPEESTLVDWPVSYDELEPYYTRLEWEIGVAGDETSPAIPRSRGLPMAAMRPFRMGNAFSQVTREMGYRPYMVPVGVNTEPYDGRPATTYTAWSNGFGSFNNAKWHPGLTHVPRAMATGNFTLRTGCRVLEILTDAGGHTRGVAYVDALGRRQEQLARTVILAAYSFENVRLLLLSGDAKHPNGLGNNAGQVGRNFMTKMFAHVDGLTPDEIWNRHTGPAAQGVILDDFLAEEFDSVAQGFIGGATLGAEQQFLPLQISREALPPDVPTWGAAYKQHLRNWQHLAVVRIQPDTLPYRTNFLSLDPTHRDRSGLGLPVLRITYDMRANEQRLADWMETKSEAILRGMGATQTWRGPRFTGVGSSHDLGGCRMGEDPAGSVVDAELQVHDTPGLYVFSGAAFPSCPGINPTLTIGALCLRAAEQLATRLVKSISAA